MKLLIRLTSLPCVEGDGDQKATAIVTKKLSTGDSDYLESRPSPQPPLKPKKQAPMSSPNKPEVKPKPLLKPRIHPSKPNRAEELQNFEKKHETMVSKFTILLSVIFLYQA